MSQAWKSFELRCAKKLSLWLTDGACDNALVRTPVSGGWPTKHAAGDITANDDVDVPEKERQCAKAFSRLFVVECKRRKGVNGGWTLEQLVTAKKHPIIEWWKETTELANRLACKRMMIITKGVRGKPFVVFGDDEMRFLKKHIIPSEEGSEYTYPAHVLFSLPWLNEKLWAFSFNDFLKQTSWIFPRERA